MDLSKLTGSIWLDGELVPWEEAKVHVLTHTFHYGLGVFEGLERTPPRIRELASSV